MTDCISLVYAENDIKLSRPIRLCVVYDKTRQDNDVTDLPRAVYTKNEIELLRLIILDAVYDENQIRQQHDRSYRCSIHRKQY